VDEPVQDGYRAIRYAVVFSGKARTLELVPAETENDGKSAQKELAEFLGRAGRQSTGGEG
jgi:hypothetical protein